MKVLQINETLNTEIICVIDKSGSMNKIKSDAIGGFNEFLSEQKKLKDNTKITVNLFDSNYKPLYKSIDIEDADELNESNYVPSSMTALYDAIGLSIDDYKEYSKNAEVKPDRVLMVIITDGEENKSCEYSRERIFQMIDEQSKLGWEFIFLAANQDAMKTASSINIKSGNTMDFMASSVGMKDTYSKLSNVVRSYRSSSDISSDNLMSDDKS
jgi:hypothetical protein